MTKQEREKRAWRTWSCVFVNKTTREKNHMFGMLWRSPDYNEPGSLHRKCVIIELNPSVWCPVERIPSGCKISSTMRNAIALAIRCDCTALTMVNLFTWCTPNPSLLRFLHIGDDTVHDHGNRLIDVCSEADKIICAWGLHGRINHRGMRIRQRLSGAGFDLSCIGYCINGEPYHVLAWQRQTCKVRLQPFKMKG